MVRFYTGARYGWFFQVVQYYNSLFPERSEAATSLHVSMLNISLYTRRAGSVAPQSAFIWYRYTRKDHIHGQKNDLYIITSECSLSPIGKQNTQWRITLDVLRYRYDAILHHTHSFLIHAEFARIGLGICYDIRFPEMAMIAARKGSLIHWPEHCNCWICYHPGAHVMIYPGAFNLTTGPMHWELLQRARLVMHKRKYSLIKFTVGLLIIKYSSLCVVQRGICPLGIMP